MLFSVLVYGLTATALCLLGWHASMREERLRQNGYNKEISFYKSWELILSVLLIAVVAGARWHTGFDHEMYLNEYEHLLNGEEMSRTTFEPAFVLVANAFAYCKAHYFFFFAFWALLQAGFLYFGLSHRKFLLPWIGLNIMMGIYFLDWCNSIRQAVCICLFVSLVPLIVERSWRNFIIYAVIIVAFSALHRSILILLPLYCLSYVPQNFGTKRTLTILIFSICVLVGLYPAWWFKPIMELINPLLKYFSYDIYQQTGLLPMLLNDGYRFVNFGPSRIGFLFVDVIILFFYPQVKRYYHDDKLLPTFFVLAFIGMCLENLLMNTSHFILRPTEYFMIFVMVVSAYILHYLWRENRRMVAILFALIINTYIIFAVYKAAYLPTRETIPFLYHTFLFPKI